MTADIYRQLCETMKSRGGLFPGMDIPEFYEMARALFSPEEAALNVALPRGVHPPEEIAARTGRDVAATASLLEAMADKGLCFSIKKGDTTGYAGVPFVPGIFEYQFMRGTHSERDRKLAALIHRYKTAVEALRKPLQERFPVMRVIPVHHVIRAENRIHTYDQVKHYIETCTSLSVSTCYCRHQAKLVDEADHCGRPDEVCIQFGAGADFVIQRGLGRSISQAEALNILEQAERAGLVHCTNNRQTIDFLCNCCSCHCVILKNAKAHPKPGLAVNSGFRPVVEATRCESCETCRDRCPMDAVGMDENSRPVVAMDQCIGCGLCATGCPTGALVMEARADRPVPPATNQALKQAIQAGLTD